VAENSTVKAKDKRFITIAGAIHCEGDCTFDCSVSALSLRGRDGEIIVNGDLLINKSVRVTADGSLRVEGNLSAMEIEVDKELYVGRNLTAEKVDVGGKLGVGGDAKAEDIDVGGKFEADGKVEKITADKRVIIKTKTKNPKVLEYQVPPKAAIFVKEGEIVKKGDQISEGSIDLKKYLKLVKKEEVWRYMLKELQKVYVSQGAAIHDKHFEIIIRQMFSRVRVKDPGDSEFLPGQIIEKAVFYEKNKELKKKGKKPIRATQIILGISKVALTTDSFLSAASFQETTRVLIRAALSAKEDYLRGLKENVIIGKLIPAGTGFRYEEKK